MRWLIVLLLAALAGAGIWLLLKPEAPTDDNVEFVFEVETGKVIPVTRSLGSGVVEVPIAVGVVGEVARPFAELGNPDRWMSANVRLPNKQIATGAELLKAMGHVVPIRFRSAAEQLRFEEQSFELNMDEGDQLHGNMFEGFVNHVGFEMRAKNHFLLVYHPDGDAEFAERLSKARKRNESKRNESKRNESKSSGTSQPK